MSRLPLLPSHEDHEARGRFPRWLHRSLPEGAANLFATRTVLEGERLHTVCEEARCPNRLECWSKKTATFLTLGKSCTRRCGFCSIDFNQAPAAPDPEEPERIAQSVQALGLRHVVLTMVARDDLEDGGAQALVNIVYALRTRCPETTIELLTSDFAGNQQAWDCVLASRPDIFNYNIETVEALSPRVRHRATYARTLQLLDYARTSKKVPFTKSGLMVGLGETEQQVQQTLRDLHQVGCLIVTIGQYLQPTRNHLKVHTFVPPDHFEQYASFGRTIGIAHVYAGPFVRSSYNAQNIYELARASAL